MQSKYIFASIALLLSAPAMSQMMQPQLLDAARKIAVILGLSPAGTELWARQSVARAAGNEYAALTRVEVEIGRELQKDGPDRRRLDALVKQYADEHAAIERNRKRRELDDAFQHGREDRQKIGLFIERSAMSSSKTARPVLQPLP